MDCGEILSVRCVRYDMYGWDGESFLEARWRLGSFYMYCLRCCNDVWHSLLHQLGCFVLLIEGIYTINKVVRLTLVVMISALNHTVLLYLELG